MYTSDKNILRLIDLLKFENKITSHQDFCNTVGVTRQTISKIRNGEANHFTVKQIENICKHYKVNANWIFGFDNEVFMK